MKLLRTFSTRRLLAMIATAVAAIAAGTAIAVAASGTGPVPPPKPLAAAIHDALAAPAVSGITAQVTFTNHLIDASNIQGSDPILTGATGRLWLSSDHRLRLELQSDSGDAQVVVNNGSFWVYDPASKTVYEGKLPSPPQNEATHKPSASDMLASVGQIQTELNRLMAHLDFSGAVPGDVAGHAAYTVRVSPKHDGGLLGAGELAVDAASGVPLRVAVYARGNTSPVLELKATGISYGPVAASVFSITPQSGAKVVKVATPGAGASDHGGARPHGVKGRRHVEIKGLGPVERALPFKLVAPSTLVGLPRRSVTLLDWGGSPAALLTYGENLGGVAVIERTAPSDTAGAPSAGSDHHRGLSLPTVSINGATGQELDTALGTMVRFTRGAVSYTLIGSVPAVAADAAARAL
ncbi:MAG: LolA family protein [Solirubrobacteraceae bacterium]